MRVIGLGVGAALVSLVVAGCSSSRETETREGPTGSVTQRIQDGTTDTTHRFAVGVCGGNGEQCWSICSGALIAPNVVVTARHCVSDAPHLINCTENPTFGESRIPQFRITTNPTMEGSGSGWHNVRELSFPSDDHICGNDIALLILEDLVPSSEAEPIIPGVQYPMWDDRYAITFTAIGYGNTSPSGQGSGTRRIKESIPVVCTPGNEYLNCPPQVNTSEFVGGDGTCSGDSGSSAYEQFSFNNEKPLSFGVLSRGGESDDGSHCVGSIYTRLDAHRQLVVDTVKVASKNWALYDEPSWTTYVPPPTKDAGPDATKPPPPKLGLGEACTEESECGSGICTDQGDGTTICSQSCSGTETASCPDGYTCKEQLCLPSTGSGPKTITTKSGCSASGPEPTPWGWACALGAAALLAAARRRRSARAS